MPEGLSTITLARCPFCASEPAMADPIRNITFDAWSTRCCGSTVANEWARRNLIPQRGDNMRPAPDRGVENNPQVENRNVVAAQIRYDVTNGRASNTNITDDIPFEEEVRLMPGTDIPPGWESGPLPAGFDWYRYADEGNLWTAIIYVDPRIQPELFAGWIQGLREWVEEKNLHVTVSRYVEHAMLGTCVSWPTHYCISERMSEEDWRDIYGNYIWPEGRACPICGETHLPYTVVCSGRTLACGMCSLIQSSSPVGTGWWELDPELPVGSLIPNNGLVCQNCAIPCVAEGCDRHTLVGFDYCPNHAEHARCSICSTGLEWVNESDDAPWLDNDALGTVCQPCSDRLCMNCNTVDDRGLTYNSDLAMYICRHCWRVALAGDGIESFDESATRRTLRIPTMPGRENVRMCGVEIEGANGTETGNDLAAAFNIEGLSVYDCMTGYHHGGESFVHVERDSSVDWEVVIGPINPASRTDVVRLNQTMRVIRDRVRDGRLGLDLRAGCHIHVEAARISLDGAFNLNTLFAYAEDVIFRLGAARWPIHRALQSDHYTQPVPKENRKLAFARTQERSEQARYFALSFNNYFSTMMTNCSCGAVRYDSWEDCTCDLGKCTFEFRVFNTTANPRKLHAYLALTQALVAKAIGMSPIVDAATDYPAQAFDPRRFKDMNSVEQATAIEMWQERLEWLLTELPLTDDEKRSLRYCIEHSELESVGEDFINELVPAQQVATEAEVTA